MSERSKATQYSKTYQPARRGRTGPVRSGLFHSKASTTALPRAYEDQRSRKAKAYTYYAAAIIDRLGTLPAAAMPSLREAGRIAVELDELGTLPLPRTGLALRRHQRRQIVLRKQLMMLEQRLAWWAGLDGKKIAGNGHSPTHADLTALATDDG